MAKKRRNSSPEYFGEVDISQYLNLSTYSNGVLIGRIHDDESTETFIRVADWEINRLITELMAAYRTIKANRGQL